MAGRRRGLGTRLFRGSRIVLRHRLLLAGYLLALSTSLLCRAPVVHAAMAPMLAGPTDILYMDADSVFYLRSQEWWSENVKHEEKLLHRALRFKYWAEHLPPDMRMVYRALGYPIGRVMLTPIHHTEEWWYYKVLEPPLRFRDGILLDPDRFERYISRL